MLKQWWRERRSAHRDEQLCSRIMQAVGTDRFEEAVSPEAARCRLWLPRLAYAALGAAAALLVVFLSTEHGEPDGARGGANGAMALARVSAYELAAGARVFSETSRLFDHRLQWMAECSGDVSLGVDAGRGPTSDAALAFVRLMVLERSAQDRTWKTAWQTDVVVRGQEVARAAIGGGNDRLALWVYALEDGRLLVDTDIDLDGPVQLAASDSAIVGAGEPSVVASLQYGDTEYRVIQTVETLGKPGDAG